MKKMMKKAPVLASALALVFLLAGQTAHAASVRMPIDPVLTRIMVCHIVGPGGGTTGGRRIGTDFLCRPVINPVLGYPF